jgi:hypothetical protein
MAWKPDYITLVQAKAFLRIDDTDDDAEISVHITTASRAIDDHTNRQFGLIAAPEERFYEPWYDYERCVWMVTIDDLMTTTGLVVSVVGGSAITDYTLEPRNAAAEGKPWTHLRINRTSSVQPILAGAEVSAVGRWGWTTVPVPVTGAARLQVSRLHSRRESPFGVAGSPDQGSELRLLAKLDPDVAVSLRGFTRPRGLA